MKTIKIYEFEELSKEAQEKALAKCGDLFDDWCCEVLKEYYTNKLINIGFYDVSVTFSLANCQGDGVFFEGVVNLNDLKKHLRLTKDDIKELDLILENQIINVRFINHKSIDVSFPNIYELEEQQYRFINDILYHDVKAWLRCTSFEFMQYGYEEINYINSDEYKIDYFINNNIYFYNNGDQVKYLHQKEVI